MKTDIQIAQEAAIEPILGIAKGLHMEADDLELYGKYKAKMNIWSGFRGIRREN